jgi:hypothetical protein
VIALESAFDEVFSRLVVDSAQHLASQSVT